MASKKDLIEAQSFSRRRLITAFTSGGAGTKELEPAKPLRAVVAGTALAALVVVGSAFSHLISPALPDGWDNGKLVVATDTGARFVSSAGTLYPVPNTASARLLLPAGQFDVVATTSQHLAKTPLGPAVGIPGAPEALPATDRLLDSGWTACTAPRTGSITQGQAAGLIVRIAAQPPAQVAQDAVLVRTGEQVWLVHQGRRYEADPGRRDQVLRSLGLADADPLDVDERWINLFEPGTPLRPFTLPGAGGAVLGTSLRAGQVVHPTSMGADETFLVGTDGSLAPLSPVALRLYRIDAPSDLGQPLDVDPAEIETLPNATQAAGSATWPHAVPELMTGAPCALTVREGNRAATVLAAVTDPPASPGGGTPVLVDPGAGALVRTAATDDEQSAERTYLVDATGTAYPVPDSEATARLGYADVTIPTLAPGWIALLPAGPELSVDAAGRGLAANQTPAGKAQ